APDQPSVQDALLRLARLRGSADELADIEKKVGRKAPPADPTSGQLVVLYEEGLIPLRRELWLPLPISTSAGDFRTFTVALPYYDNWSEPSLPLTISAGGVHGQASELGNIEALAAYDLKERLPGMVTRQLLRLFAKEQVRQVASQQANDIGNLVVGIFNTLSEHADTRSWSTLPARASVWSASLPAGSQSVELNGRRERVVINPGRTTLVWVNRVAPDLQIRTISL
ncbi:MAG: COG3014 family protein, partial [Aeromonas sp.]